MRNDKLTSLPYTEADTIVLLLLLNTHELLALPWYNIILLRYLKLQLLVTYGFDQPMGGAMSRDYVYLFLLTDRFVLCFCCILYIYVLWTDLLKAQTWLYTLICCLCVCVCVSSTGIIWISRWLHAFREVTCPKVGYWCSASSSVFVLTWKMLVKRLSHIFPCHFLWLTHIHRLTIKQRPEENSVNTLCVSEMRW